MLQPTSSVAPAQVAESRVAREERELLQAPPYLWEFERSSGIESLKDTPAQKLSPAFGPGSSLSQLFFPE